MGTPADDELYRIGSATLVASWELYARGAADASLRRLPGVAAGVFPRGPERAVYNNALLERDLAPAGRAHALAAMEAAYAAAGVTRFAAWVHASDAAMRGELERRGHTVDTTTRAMGMALDGPLPPRPDVDAATPAWGDYVRDFGLPPDLLAGADRSALQVLVARSEGRSAATALAFDHGTDCGIYNVATLEHARRRGLGGALTALHLHAALARGCRTASLQATPMAERMYAAAGFRDLGRILEYVPVARPVSTRRARAMG